MFQNSVIRLQILVICHFKNAKLKTFTLLREFFFSNFEMRKSTNLSHSKISNCFLSIHFLSTYWLLLPSFSKYKIKIFHTLERTKNFCFFQILKFWNEKRQRIFCLRRSVDTSFHPWISWKKSWNIF